MGRLVLSVLSGPVVLGVALGVTLRLKGPNVSDVGVPMYPNAPVAMLAGFMVMGLGHMAAGSWLAKQENPARMVGLVSLLICGVAGVWMVGVAGSF
jgi:hypothetical protein